MINLTPAWSVLETEAASNESAVVQTVESGVVVKAGPVLVGVNGSSNRLILIPLLAGEAVAESRDAKAVQVRRMAVDGRECVAIVCDTPAVYDVFARLAADILNEISDATSPANRAVEVLNRWKDLLSASMKAASLNDEQLIGLMAELMCAQDIASRDPLRRLDSWTGPSGHQHDFFCGDIGVEVKASASREGRLVAISSIDQLDAVPGDRLYLAYHRFQPAQEGQGSSLVTEWQKLLDLGVDRGELHRRLAQEGVDLGQVEYYESKRFVLTERLVYDTDQDAFPRITRSSFVGGSIPPGTMRLRYTIDLTNEPPTPLESADVDDLWTRCAG